MSAHISTFVDPDRDGWPIVSCSCGWSFGPLPDWETAADAWGDHRAETALDEIAALVVPAADTATEDNSPEAMRARRGGTPCDCPTLRNVGAGWYCGVHGYQDVPAADTATQDQP